MCIRDSPWEAGGIEGRACRSWDVPERGIVPLTGSGCNYKRGGESAHSFHQQTQTTINYNNRASLNSHALPHSNAKMKFLVASVALFGVATAAPAARSAAPQPMAMPCPTTTATSTPTETESPTAECQVTPGAVTDVLPAGLKGVMVSNVAYYAAPALYGCADKAKFMKIWAVPDCKHGDESFKFWYCCGSECDRIPSVPKNTTCEVQGKEYTVGFTYENVELKNKDGEKEKVTLWCTTEDDHVTCKGDKCGSSLELTPVRTCCTSCIRTVCL